MFPSFIWKLIDFGFIFRVTDGCFGLKFVTLAARVERRRFFPSPTHLNASHIAERVLQHSNNPDTAVWFSTPSPRLAGLLGRTWQEYLAAPHSMPYYFHYIRGLCRSRGIVKTQGMMEENTELRSSVGHLFSPGEFKHST